MSYLWEVIESEMERLRNSYDELRERHQLMTEERNEFYADTLRMAKELGHEAMRGKSAI